MNAKPNDALQWAPCPPGELEQMVRRIKLRRRREVLRKLGGTVAVVAVAGMGGYIALGWLGQPNEYYFGGIACKDVRRLLPEYHAGKLRGALARQINVHLANCPNCGPAYRKMVALTGGVA